MTEPTTLLVQRDAGVVTVTINRPERKNALNPQCWLELNQVFDEVRLSPEDRALVLTGAGGTFCSGADLTDPTNRRRGPMVDVIRRANETALRLHRLTIPTIAKVDGAAVGYGIGLALGCDLVVASERARFSEIFARRAIAFDGGNSWLLPRLVGLHKAKELAFFGDMVSATEAASIGLINKVVPLEELDDVVEKWARRLADGPTVALGLIKTLLNQSFASSMDQALEDEARSQHIAFGTSDATEALRAFRDKREPTFKGE
jgi:2-(1,2-epoxy-1,2-dihydrophenyl)acetyl-CoA isomerase